MTDNKHNTPPPPKAPVKDSFPAKSPQHQAPQHQAPNQPAGTQAPRQGAGQSGVNSPNRDPGTGDVDPLVRPTETLPVAANTDPRGEPVGHARHAESPEEVEKIQAMEGFGANNERKVPPPGSRHYVAGQPVNDEEYERTENEANRLAEAGKAQRSEAEQRMAENTPGDPDYHPADTEKRDTPQAQGQDPNKRGASDQPGQTNPFPRGKEDPHK